MGASSRYRSVQYFDALRKAGHEVVQSHFFSDRYLRAKYAGKVAYLEIAKAYARRFYSMIVRARSADIVFVEKESFPFLPAITERLMRLGKATIIYDYDDAIWHSYEARSFGPLTDTLRGKIAAVVKGSDHVIAGSQYLVDQVKEWGAPNVSKIPTTVPASSYDGRGLSVNKDIDLVWIGSMSTGPYLDDVFPVIERLFEERGSRIRLIGYPESHFGGTVPPYAQVCPWSPETERDQLASARIGIMPLPDSPYERGKCGFKLIQYMGMGLPVIASPVGENRLIVEEGASGYLATSQDDWFRQISALLDAPERAEQMGRHGYERFKKHYSTESAAEKMLGTIESSIAIKSESARAGRW